MTNIILKCFLPFGSHFDPPSVFNRKKCLYSFENSVQWLCPWSPTPVHIRGNGLEWCMVIMGFGARLNAGYFKSDIFSTKFLDQQWVRLMFCWAEAVAENSQWGCARLVIRAGIRAGLVQDYSFSIANALEILQSCTKPSICRDFTECLTWQTPNVECIANELYAVPTWQRFWWPAQIQPDIWYL